MGLAVAVLPPLELELDDLGRRVVPLQSLRYVLEAALRAGGAAASLETLLEAVQAAEDAPLPGHTPLRASWPPADDPIPGLVLAEPVMDPELGLIHPGAVE